MGVEELAMMMDLARQVGVLLARRLEHHLNPPSVIFSRDRKQRIKAYLGTVGELVRGEVHFAERAFSNQPPNGVISHAPKILGRELSVGHGARVSTGGFEGAEKGRRRTRVIHCKSWQAVTARDLVSQGGRGPETPGRTFSFCFWL